MLIIKTTELRKLQETLNNVSTNMIIPVLSYLKFQWQPGKETIEVTKNNLKAFVIKQIPIMNPQGEAGSFLVEQKILFNFIAFTQEELVSMEIVDKNIILKAGKAKLQSNCEPAEHFPAVEVGSLEAAQDINLDYARLVAQIINYDEIPSPTNHVFIGKNGTAGGDGFVIMYQPTASNEVQLALRGEVIKALPSEPLKHTSGNNYDYFFTDKAQYGFVKSEINWMDLSKFFQYESSEGFTCGKDSIVRFNDLAMASSINAKSIAAEWEPTGALKMQDAAYNIDVNDQLTFTGTMFKFAYLPAIMNKLLRALPYEDLQLSYSKNAAYIKTEDGTISIIQELKK